MKSLRQNYVQWLSLSPGKALLLFAIAHVFFLLWLGLTRHWNYLTSIFDLGVYDQSLWGIVNGRPFLSSVYDIGPSLNRLGVHFNPIMVVISPLYMLLPAAEWLIIAQALVIAIPAWPLYVIGRRILESDKAAVMWTIAYLLNPFVLSAGAWDFQSIMLAAPFMAVAMLAIEFRLPKLLLSCGFLLLLVREHLGLAVLGFGVLWWIRQRTLLPGLLSICIGALGFILVLGFAMPALSPTGSVVMLSEGFGQLSRYAWLGESAPEMLRVLVRNPVDLLLFVLFGMGGWAYLFFLLIPLALTPLLGGEFLLPAAADLAANLLSANPMPRNVLSYHSIAIIPVLIVAGMHGARRLSTFNRYSVQGLGKLVLLASLLMTYRFLPLPLPGATNIWEPLEYRTWPEESVAEIRQLLPPTVSVSAQANIAAHFTQREKIMAFPDGLGEVDCVVLRLSSPTARVEGNDPGEVGSLAHHLAMAPGAYLASVRNLITSGEYGLEYWNRPWLLACRGSFMVDGERAVLLRELDEVAGRWSVSEAR